MAIESTCLAFMLWCAEPGEVILTLRLRKYLTEDEERSAKIVILDSETLWDANVVPSDY